MKTYRIRVRRIVVHEHVITVTAENRDAANVKASEVADERGDMNAGTSYGEWKVVKKLVPADDNRTYEGE